MLDKTVSKGEIFVMDNDAATRATLSLVLQQEGHDVICFADSASLLLSARARNPACIFLEIAAPEKSGLDILQRLRAEDCCVPIFAISGQADIPTAVDAIRNGAFDFIQKPLLRSEIVPLVRQAIGTRPPSGDADARRPALSFPGCKPLTRRERDVLAQIAAGASNKEAARQLGLSSRTVEDHRANLMRKIGVKNAADLVRRVFSENLHS